MREPRVDGGERVACRGCGGDVPDVDGPTHAYIPSSPGCWAVYGRWMAAQARTADVAPRVSGHHVDCYAVQHPDGADGDRRQRQSVAVHLVSLCLLVEHRASPSIATRARARTSRTVLHAVDLDDWPLLPPPLDRGATTVSDVAQAGERLDEVFDRWADDCWQAWCAHHDTVRAWAEVTVGTL